jgi:hypothetical protein
MHVSAIVLQQLGELFYGIKAYINELLPVDNNYIADLLEMKLKLCAK